MAACSATVLVVLALVTRGLADVLRCSERDDKSFMYAYGALYLRYEDRCYLWEFLVIARKYSETQKRWTGQTCCMQRLGEQTICQ